MRKCRQRVSDISCFRRSGFATTSYIDNILIINNLALLLLLLRLDIMSSRLLLSMQAASIDHFEESHIFQGMKQDPRKKEAIMHMGQFLRAKSSLVARAFLPYMPGSQERIYMPLYRPHQKYTSRKYYYSRCPWTPLPLYSQEASGRVTERAAASLENLRSLNQGRSRHEYLLSILDLQVTHSSARNSRRKFHSTPAPCPPTTCARSSSTLDQSPVNDREVHCCHQSLEKHGRYARLMRAANIQPTCRSYASGYGL